MACSSPRSGLTRLRINRVSLKEPITRKDVGGSPQLLPCSVSHAERFQGAVS